MNNLKEAARQALEALEGVLNDSPKVREASITGGLYEVVQCREAITALRQALEQPVNWQEIECPCCGELARAFPPTQPREWVGLTDEELVSAYMNVGDKEWAIGGMRDATKFARAI